MATMKFGGRLYEVPEGHTLLEALLIGEKQEREERIKEALTAGTYDERLSLPRGKRLEIARCLYDAKWTAKDPEAVTKEDLLDELCSYVFGAEADEVIEAYDRFLG